MEFYKTDYSLTNGHVTLLNLVMYNDCTESKPLVVAYNKLIKLQYPTFQVCNLLENLCVKLSVILSSYTCSYGWTHFRFKKEEQIFQNSYQDLTEHVWD